jgi:hypothetical protein
MVIFFPPVSLSDGVHNTCYIYINFYKKATGEAQGGKKSMNQ